jgi:TP901 family phage tail tape measure protein
MSGTDKSTLEITVITTGLNGNGGAPAQLNKLGEAAGKAEPKVAGLLATIEKLMKVQTTATATAKAYVQAIQGSTTGLGAGAASSKSLANATTKLAEAMLVLSNGLNTVQTRTAGAERSLISYIGTMRDGQAAARGFAGSLGALWTTYGNLAPLAAGLAIGASMKGIVMVGKEVEHTLEGIRVRGQESLASIDNMRSTIMDLGKGVYGPIEVAKALETMILAGLSAKEAMTGVRDALNLATVGGTSIEKAAEVLVQVGTALDYSSNAYGRIADVISMTAAASMSSVESISESFKAGSAVGKLYGASLEDIGASFAMLSNLGIKGSAAGTSLKNFFSDLNSGSKKVTDGLKAIGLTIADLKDPKGKFLGLEEIFVTLADGLDTLEEKYQGVVIAQITNERGNKLMVEGLSKVRKAAKEGSEDFNELGELMTKINNAFGMAAIGAAAMAMTIDSQFKSVKNTLQTQFLAAFDNIAPQMSVVAQALKATFASKEFERGIQGIALSLADLAVTLAENIGLIMTVIKWLLAFKAVGFVVGIITAVAEGILAVTAAMKLGTIAAAGFNIALGALGIALTIAAAAWAWYHLKKDDVNSDYKASISYMDDFTGKLNEEATRLEKQLSLMREGKTAREAETQAIRDQQLALVNLNGEKAVASQVARVVEAKEKLSPSEMKSYERAKAGGMSGIQGLVNVNAVLQAERDTESAIAATNKKREEAIAGQKRVVEVSKEIARVAAQQAKDAQANPNSEDGVPPVGTPKGRRGPDLMKQENDEFARRMEQYTVGIAVQNEMNRGMREMGLEYEKLTPAMKTQMKLEYELSLLRATGLTKAEELRRNNLLIELDSVRKLATLEKEGAFEKAKLESAAALQKDTDTRIATIQKEAEATEMKVLAFGNLKGTTDLMLAQGLETQKQALIDAGITGKVIEDIEREIAARQRLANAKGNLGVEQLNTEAMKDLDKFLNPKKALDFGNAMESAFGSAGKAIDGMAKAFDRYTNQQEKNEKARKSANNLKTEKERAKVMAQINDEELKDKLAYYGDTAAAAKSFFKENSKGYQAMEAVEKGFRMMEMAMALKAFVMKTFFIESVTAAKGAAAAEELITEEMSTAETISLAMMTANAKAVEGVANQSGGDPYSAFARMAVMAAIMAGLGLAVGGGSGSAPTVDIAKERQKAQGTGTVLGDESAKSESIANSIERLAENSDITMPYTSKMLMSLRNIEAGIGGMANFVARSAGLRGTAVDEAKFGVGSSKSGLGFGGKSTTLDDTGIIFKTQTIGDAINGVLASSYADITKKKSSWWGMSSSTKHSTELGDLDSGLEEQISLTLEDMVKGISTAAEALGRSGPEVTAQLEGMYLGLDRISLKGLSGDELTSELEAVFGSIGDRMAESVFGNLKDFQKVGEGFMETAVRVATGTEQARVALAEIGLTAVNLHSIVNKQGDIGAEMTRQTLMQQERSMIQVAGLWGHWGFRLMAGPLNGIGEIIETLDGSATDLIETYKQLVHIRNQMKGAGLGENLNRDMVIGAGGLEELAQGMDDFIDGMFTDAEKLTMMQANMTESFAALGQGLPATSAAFKTLVQQVSGSGNNVLAGKLIALSGGFNELQGAITDMAEAAADAAEEAARAAEEKAEAEKKAAEDAKEARDKLLADAHSALTAAYEKESSALETTITKFEDFAKTLRTFRDGLMTGASSPLTPGGKYAAAGAKYASAMALAQTGDKDAMASITSIAQEFLTLSRDYNASGDAYLADFNRVMTETGMLQSFAEKQVDVAKASLTALEKQVAGLDAVKEATMSVELAVRQLYDALVTTKETSKYDAMAASMMNTYAGQTDPASLSMYKDMMAGGASYQAIKDAIVSAYPMDGSHAMGLSYVPFNGYRAELHEGEAVLTASENKQYQLGFGNKGSDSGLVEEVKALRQQLQTLTEEQRQQTQALIGANYDAQQSAACAVVDGVGDALSQSARIASVKPSLN